MKCPKCKSENTKRVYSGDPNWHMGHQRCKECNYQDDWGEFLDPPFRIVSIDPEGKNE